MSGTVSFSRPLANLGGTISRWRRRRKASPVWSAVTASILAVLVLPVATILVLGLTPGADTPAALMTFVLPQALLTTLLLMALTGAATLVVGTLAAWLVTLYRFPGRRLADRLLVLPLAMPAYLTAFTYGDLLSYAGPLQTGLRHLFHLGAGSASVLPDVRSLGGAVFVLSAALYPYVYLSARASFLTQSVCALEVGRTLGRTPMGVFLSIALPMARPALVAGTALVVMECMADFAAVQYLGVATLTPTIFSTWLQRGSLGGAARLATLLLVLIAVIVVAERWGRGEARSHTTTGRYRSVPFHELEGWTGIAALAACLLPAALGFAIPALLLLANALHHADGVLDEAFWPAARNSILLAATAGVASIGLALMLSYARRVAPNSLTRLGVTVAGLGYALPGTVLAIGLLIPLGALDNGIDAFMRASFGVKTGLLLTGSVVSLSLGYVTRFLAVALGAVEAGLTRISPNLDAAARALGETPLSVLKRVHVPLLIPSLASGALLVFVDAMKELPATLLMRPFNFDTLATRVYELAALEEFEQAAPGALAIVVAGLIPVLVLHRTLTQNS